MTEMVSLVQEHIDEIRRLCREYHVAQLYVFGSAITDAFVPGKSDVDFLVNFEPMAPHDHLHAYMGLADELEQLLGTKVDLVEEQPLRNPYFIKDVMATRVSVYAA